MLREKREESVKAGEYSLANGSKKIVNLNLLYSCIIKYFIPSIIIIAYLCSANLPIFTLF